MNVNGNEKLGLEKRTASDHCSSGLAPMVPPNSNVGISPVIPMASPLCTSAAMADSYSSGHWSRQPLISANSGFSESSNNPAANSARTVKPADMPSRGMLFPSVQGFIHPSLSHFPTDSAFIERAARFSCFNGGNVSGLINSLGPPPAMAVYTSILKDPMCAQFQKPEFNATKAQDVPPHVDHRSNTVSLLMNQGDKASTRVPALNGGSHEDNLAEAAQEADVSSPDAVDHSSPNDLRAKKRKRTDQNNIELDQVQHEPSSSSLDAATKIPKSKHKPEQISSKAGGKSVKDGSETAKEDYVHVRARRGQATNSHSLAERVRREKISERMKYLQDLVPGCSKVTGKAVMLDEIINYVQSLQRQVEFLSMKLAAVNPRLDYNIEGLLAKDLLQSRGGPFSISGFSQVHPQLHASQQGFIQPGMSGRVNASDAFRKAMSTPFTNMNGYKDYIPQMQNPWNEEIHNAMQMTYNSNPSLDAQELNREPNDGFGI